MDETRASLLIRIKDPRNTAAWAEFHDLYAPFLYHYARVRGLSHEDAEDVRATCYEAVVRQLPHFSYDKQKGGFKAWLRTIVNRRVVDLLRKRRELQADAHELNAVPEDAPAAEELWEQQWRQQHLRYCLQQAASQVSAQSFEVFQLLVEQRMSVPQVCEKLGINANQVYKAKARVLAAVREIMEAMFPEETS